MDGVNSAASHFSVNSSPSSNPAMPDATGKSLVVKSESAAGGGNSAAAAVTAPSPSILGSSNVKGGGGGGTSVNAINSERKILDKRKLSDLVKEVDPLLQLDDDVEEMILQIADDFIDNAVSSACELAKHRKSNTLESKDLHLILERNYNIYVPGLGADDLRPLKKSHGTEAHKQRIALIKKTMKKF